MWGKGLWEISVPSAQLCCEHKTALNIKPIKIKNSVYVVIITLLIKTWKHNWHVLCMFFIQVYTQF